MEWAWPLEIDLALTFNCGQVFHWLPDGDGYIGAAGGHAARVFCESGCLVVNAQSGEEAFWRHYFGVDDDYNAMLSPLRESPQLCFAIDACPGLRLLHQPSWEVLLAFLISQNNNITRITRTVVGLGKAAYPELCESGACFLPGPGEIIALGEGKLRELGAGYRVPYILRSAQAVLEGFPLERLAALSYEEAKASLISLHGVGPKVADCVLLFGCEHLEACPVDVWMARALAPLFPDVAGREKLALAARTQWGRAAGLMQQMLFHSARTGVAREGNGGDAVPAPLPGA